MSMIAVQPLSSLATTTGSGSARSQSASANDGEAPQALVFAVGNAGERYASVKVVIKDETGSTVASFALAALSGTQNVIWTPKPGSPAGGYAAYWEGSRLAVEAI